MEKSTNIKKYQCKNNTSIIIELSSNTKNIDILDNIFTLYYNIFDIIEIIKIIKSAIKCDKGIFRVTILKNNNIDKIVHFNNGKLIKYAAKEKTDNYEMNIKYSRRSGTKIIVLDKNKKIEEYKYEQANKINILDNIFNVKIENNLKKIKTIEDISKLAITTEGKSLYTAYKLFYNETPEFNCPEVKIKMQAMAYILENYGIKLIEFSDFQLFENIVTSQNILKQVDKIFIVPNQDKELKFRKDIEREIISIGNIINEVLVNENNKLSALISLTSQIYNNKYISKKYQSVEETLSLIKRKRNEEQI